MTEAELAGLTLVIGGAASGKSAHAEGLVRRMAEAAGAVPVYLATAEAHDAEMTARIRRHRTRRHGWQTLEAPHDLPAVLGTVPADAPCLVDCLTLWLTNRLLAEADLADEEEALLSALAARAGKGGATVLVSNEVGQGIVPENPLARRFRELQGRLNQRVATRAERVILVAAGLPLVLKDRQTGPA